MNKVVKLEVVTHENEKKPNNAQCKVIKKKTNDKIDSLRKVSLPLLPDRVRDKE